MLRISGAEAQALVFVKHQGEPNVSSGPRTTSLDLERRANAPPPIPGVRISESPHLMATAEAREVPLLLYTSGLTGSSAICLGCILGDWSQDQGLMRSGSALDSGLRDLCQSQQLGQVFSSQSGCSC